MAGLILALNIGAAYAKHPKLSPYLEGRDANSTVEVIVKYRSAPTEAHHQRVRAHGGTHKATLELVRGAAYSVPARELESLASDPDVEFVYPDRPMAASLNYLRAAVGADVARQQYGFTGKGVGVALIDSGIDPSNNKDLLDAAGKVSRVVYSQDFTAEKTTNGQDNFGHGTHIAGIIAGNGTNSLSTDKSHPNRAYLGGIAPEANLINLKVLDKNGAGTESLAISAIQAAISLKATYNI